MAGVSGRLMESEIREQPEAWAHLLSRADRVADVAERIRAAQPRFVTFVARGTSDHAATFGRYAADVLCGLPGGSWSPSTTTLYGARPDLRGALAIGVSQSGGSPDLAASLAAARDGGALTLQASATLCLDSCLRVEGTKRPRSTHVGRGRFRAA